MFSLEDPGLPLPPDAPPPPPQHPLLQYNTLTEGALTTTTPTVTYRLEVPSAGRVRISLTRPVEGGFPNNQADVRWLNATNAQLVTDRVGTGNFGRFLDLEAGTYFIEVVRRGTNTGRFFIAADFTCAENHTRAVNNTIANAEPLSFAQQRIGFLSHQNRVDIYRIELSQSGRVTVNLTRPVVNGFPNSRADVRWMNDNGIQIAIDQVGSGAFTRFLDLEAGTYFIEVSRRNITDTGRYFLTANFATSGRTASSPISTIATAQRLGFGESVTGFLTHQRGLNYFEVTVPAGNSRSVTVNLTRPAVGGFPDVSPFGGTHGVDVRWLNADGTQLFANGVGSGAFRNTRTLAPGTYFIGITRRSTSSTGIYNLVINMT
jgi:hypothetical protein